MAYQWCSAISEVAGQLGLDEMDTSRQRWSHNFSHQYEEEFAQVGSSFVPPHSDNASHIRGYPEDPTPNEYLDFLAPLKVAFRLAEPTRSKLHQVELNHTSHHDRVFRTAFSSDDDEVIADAACAWIARDPKPGGSLTHYFAKRVERGGGFSPRLRQTAIDAIEEVGSREFAARGLEVLGLLNCLGVRADDVDDKDKWRTLLVEVIRSPAGAVGLAPHYWRLLGELIVTEAYPREESSRMLDVEVMRSLEEAEDWEKLEVWIAVVWWSLPRPEPTPELVEVVGDTTLRLISLRPSALQRLEDLSKRVYPDGARARLRDVLDQARVGRLNSEAQHQPYVSVHSSLFLSVLTSFLFHSSQLVPTKSSVSLPLGEDDAFLEYAVG